MPLQVVVMGVSGTGKSTVGTAVADRLGWPFVEGDDLHPRSNVVKMESGEPLTDADRAPWLVAIRELAVEESAAGRSAVITCSALKRQYREALGEGGDEMFFVHLDADQDVLEPRMAKRERHFMPAALLTSQLDTLESLADDEDGTVVDVGQPVDEVVAEVHRAVSERLRS
jgi:gluconokinase